MWWVKEAYKQQQLAVEVAAIYKYHNLRTLEQACQTQCLLRATPHLQVTSCDYTARFVIVFILR
jgi:hypothetical protein